MGTTFAQSGDLDRPIELRHRTLAAPNSSGEKVGSWASPGYARVFAKKEDLRGSKRFLAQQFSGDQMTEFTLRWRPDVHITDRLVLIDTGDIYEIVQVAEVNRRQGLDLLCRRLAT